MNEKVFRVIDGFDCENKPCKLIENTITTEQYNTENELEANSLCELVNEKEERIKKLSEENEELKQSNQEAIELIHDGIVEMHDGKRDYAEKLLNKAIELIK